MILTFPSQRKVVYPPSQPEPERYSRFATLFEMFSFYGGFDPDDTLLAHMEDGSLVAFGAWSSMPDKRRIVCIQVRGTSTVLWRKGGEVRVAVLCPCCNFQFYATEGETMCAPCTEGTHDWGCVNH